MVRKRTLKRIAEDDDVPCVWCGQLFPPFTIETHERLCKRTFPVWVKVGADGIPLMYGAMIGEDKPEGPAYQRATLTLSPPPPKSRRKDKP